MPCTPDQPQQALNHVMCFSAAPEWGIDFQEGSFHYSMPATLNLDYSIYWKSQNHCKGTCSGVLGRGEDDLYFCFNEIAHGEHTEDDAARFGGLLHNFPQHLMLSGIYMRPGSASSAAAMSFTSVTS